MSDLKVLDFSKKPSDDDDETQVVIVYWESGHIEEFITTALVTYPGSELLFIESESGDTHILNSSYITRILVKQDKSF